MHDTITSLYNPRVKDAIQLRRRRGRDQQQRVLIDGTREVSRALAAGVDILELFVCQDSCDQSARSLLEGCRQRSLKVSSVTAAVFEKLAFGERAEGIVAVAKLPGKSLGDIPSVSQALVVVIEAVEKPGNVGAVLRTADAAGATAVIAADARTDIYNPNAIRASLGAIFSVPCCQAASVETLAWLRQRQLRLLAARVDGAVDYTTVSYREPCAIILGSEAEGLSAVWDAKDITAVRLPMLGAVDSLNVSTTAAILLYEALRQRRNG